MPREGAVEEPVWLVRIVFLLFLAAFAAFVARELWLVLRAFFG